MLQRRAKCRSSFVLRGALAAVFALTAFSWQAITLSSLRILVAIASGIVLRLLGLRLQKLSKRLHEAMA